MFQRLENVAIIPARIGSKRIKKKNIKFFYGKPILQWTYEINKKSPIFILKETSLKKNILSKLKIK